MSKLALSALIWACAFFAFELPAIFWPSCPWFTLSSTVSGGIKWWHPLALAVTLFIATLWGHFEHGWSARWLILEGVLMAISIAAHVA